MIPANLKEYYGDETRWFIGRVISINDPLKLGRVQVRIYGVHSENTSDIPQGDLPWASVNVPITEGGSSGIGTVVGIKPMAQVFGIFLDGQNSQLPLILGSIPKFEVEGDRGKITSLPKGAQNQSVDNIQNPTYRNNSPASTIDDDYLEGSTNAEKAYNYFMRLNYEPHIAAGIIGNLMIESGPTDIDPLAVNNAEGSKGIAQWNPASGRLDSLQTFCNNANIPWESLYGQLSFIRYELEEVQEDFGFWPLMASKDVEEATEVFHDKYEKPEIGSLPRRLAEARKILDAMEA